MASSHKYITEYEHDVVGLYNTCILKAVIISVDYDNDKADIELTEPALGLRSGVPVFYHCAGSEDTVGGSVAFSEDDEVLVFCRNCKDSLFSGSLMKVVGFVDGLKQCNVERVYVSMKVGLVERCFVWDASKNACADVELNIGGLATFPCDPDDISDWKADQVNIGMNLYNVSDCGRSPFCDPELVCPRGEFGTLGEVADSKEEISACDDTFTDVGNCTTSWDYTNVCYTWPPSLIHWEWSGSWNQVHSFNVIFLGSKFFEFQNNSGVESAFKIEYGGTGIESGWSCNDASCCGEPCDNYTLDPGVYTKTYKFHTPLKSDILEINGTSTRSFDVRADTGSYQETDYLVDHKLSLEGVYSTNIIVQIYTVEAKTVTRTMDGTMWWGGYCLGGSCNWINQDYTTYGLKITAQVGVFNDTEGVDPTGLFRNSSFEWAINAMYNNLRVSEGISDDEMLDPEIGLSILKGPG